MKTGFGLHPDTRTGLALFETSERAGRVQHAAATD
jgi:hypothetical protein